MFSLCCQVSFAADIDITMQAQMQKHISNIGFKILNANKIDKRIVFYYKHDNKSMNACTHYVDRSIAFYRGLAVTMESDDEYAAVLSHEISHGIDYYDGIFKGFFSYLPTSLSPKKYEQKADKRAVDYMVKAGYNPLALIVVMSKDFPQTRYDIFATHPLTSKRMAYIYEYIYNKYPAYLANNEYKNNIYYQNFLLTSRANRLKLQERVENPEKKNSKIQYL